MIMSNKMYVILKFAAELVLPALGTLYFALAQIWGWPHGEEIVGTLTAIDAFLGIFVKRSKTLYKRQEDAKNGN